jgi:hypothetical protein
MARVYGALGAEKVLIQKLYEAGIRSLRSLDDVERHINESGSFIAKRTEEERESLLQEASSLERQTRVLSERLDEQRARRRAKLTEEGDTLRAVLAVEPEPTRNPISMLLRGLKRWRQNRRLRTLENRFEDELNRPLRKLIEEISSTTRAREYILSDLDNLIRQRLTKEIKQKEHIDRTLNELQSWVSGARGERQVLQTLSSLPDSYVIFNDFILDLNPPMRSPEGMRFRCQADHVVIGPSGVFNIETKNWSEASVRSLDLRSPVEQVKLTGKAIFREVNRAVRDREIRVGGHHWGDSKISVRNILAMVSAMPPTEFQWVKMLPLSRLNGYIQYFEQVFSSKEVEEIAAYVYRCCTESA